MSRTELAMAAVILILLGAICLLVFRNRRLKKDIYYFVDRMDRCLEEMIQGKEGLEFDETGEDVLSRQQTKLKRLYEMKHQYALSSRREKEQIQSLISDISHQTKTPVANMKMYLEILENRDNSPEKTQEFLKQIKGQVEKLDFLIRSMLKMSRLESGILRLVKTPAPVFETIGNALAAIQGRAGQKKIRISVDCPQKLIVSHDRKWTEEAIYNVLDNAVKYTEEGGEVRIMAVRQEMFVKISIRDTGKGIAEENRGKIFSRFYREEDVHGQEGVGIGLYLTREIITRQQGYIEVRSKKGKGSEFQIYLPV